jgi:FkbM family methyltransferase
MELYDRANGSGIFIQIGAGAGDLDSRANYRDGFTEFVKSLPANRIKKIILVEPNPLNISQLKECWKDYPQAIIYSTAIVPKNYKNNVTTLFYCPQDAPHYQVASINKNHTQAFFGGNGCELKSFVVPARYLENFLNEITNEEIELLALDIEGIDAEVILDLRLNEMKIKYLSFEYIHLGSNEDKVKNHLSLNNFLFLGKGVDHNGFDYLYIKK